MGDHNRYINDAFYDRFAEEMIPSNQVGKGQAKKKNQARPDKGNFHGQQDRAYDFRIEKRTDQTVPANTAEKANQRDDDKEQNNA